MTSDHRAEISLEWLVRLRWGAVVGQLLTVGVARALLGAEFPLARLLVFISILAASNAIMAAIAPRDRSPRALCGAALTLDTLLLTGLLHATGGPTTCSASSTWCTSLAAVVLRARWTWFLAAPGSRPHGSCSPRIPLQRLDHSAPEMSPFQGHGWLSASPRSSAFFVVKLATAVERRRAAAEYGSGPRTSGGGRHTQARARPQLGTPLATSRWRREGLERAIRGLPPDQADRLIADAALIRSELDRCRAILNRLATDSGQMPGEAPQELRGEDLVAAILEGLPAHQRSRLTLATPADGAVVHLPAPRGAGRPEPPLRNAAEAAEGRVALSVETADSRADPRAGRRLGWRPTCCRVGEPFFHEEMWPGPRPGRVHRRTLTNRCGRPPSNRWPAAARSPWSRRGPPPGQDPMPDISAVERSL